MSPGAFYTILMFFSAFVMLFQLRAMLQSSSADYYHPFTQAVTKLTNPLVNLSFLRQLRIGSFFIAGFIVSFVIAVIFWCILTPFVIGMPIPLSFAFVCAILMVIKNFGFLVLILLFVQALTSFLPPTQGFSYLLGQVTEFLTRPVRRLIPPIGMIDLSVMIVMLAIYALNWLIVNILFSLNIFLAQIWQTL